MMNDFRRFAVGAVILLAALPAGAQSPAPTPSPAAAHPPGVTTYQIDPVHSELTFRVRHLLGRVAGTFRDWGGTVAIDATNPANSKVDVTVKTASVETLKAERDTHLRTKDFFAVEQFPDMTFRSTSVRVDGKAIRLVGDLTIRDKTKSVVLDGTYEGRFKDPWGKMRTAFLARTTINRQDFGVSFNGPFEQIGQIGDDVAIEIAIEAVQQ
jgi:polyisoprenoid-binding protein YceI